MDILYISTNIFYIVAYIHNLARRIGGANEIGPLIPRPDLINPAASSEQLPYRAFHATRSEFCGYRHGF